MIRQRYTQKIASALARAGERAKNRHKEKPNANGMDDSPIGIRIYSDGSGAITSWHNQEDLETFGVYEEAEEIVTKIDSLYIKETK